jgi:hypothetical protein
MRITTRLVITALAALSAIALFAGSASASRALSITPSTGLITLASSSPWTFAGSNGTNIICERVVLLISLATSQIAKSANNRLPEGLVGWVTEGRTERCRESLFGSEIRTVILARKNARETWFPLLYKAFLGTLPSINGILLQSLNAAFEFTSALIGRALYRGSPGNLIAFNASQQSERNRFKEEAANAATQNEPRNSNYPPQGTLRGSGTINPVLTISLL